MNVKCQAYIDLFSITNLYFRAIVVLVGGLGVWKIVAIFAHTLVRTSSKAESADWHTLWTEIHKYAIKLTAIGT